MSFVIKQPLVEKKKNTYCYYLKLCGSSFLFAQVKKLVKYELQKTTVMILSFRTDRSGQTVQTQIRLLEQSDQGLHCLQFLLHLLGALLFGKAILFKF